MVASILEITTQHVAIADKTQTKPTNFCYQENRLRLGSTISNYRKEFRVPIGAIKINKKAVCTNGGFWAKFQVGFVLLKLVTYRNLIHHPKI